jgi:hypothetical protein
MRPHEPSTEAEANNNIWTKKRLPIEGLYKNRAARVAPDGEFTNIDRKWRAQFLKDQVLSEADRHMYQVRRRLASELA